ncbi:hypothetical protein Salat_0504200 [Sesamum alatum]|uniref:CUE domain-containing protein n=1 Tax=Sesamum alatum TaxID=300844 RepID=A0AAE2D0V0_9LAMI|nr:hypothetical protein Salat_0504200 [Sesamum alatum]
MAEVTKITNLLAPEFRGNSLTKDHSSLHTSVYPSSACSFSSLRTDLCNSKMGFSKVYKSLQEVFPQIDARVLRAVAIEHSKDVDAAVEAVLLEIIPYFTERSRPSAPSSGSIAVGGSSEGNSSFVDAVAATSTADGLFMKRVGSAEVQDGCNMNGGSQQSLRAAVDDERKNLMYKTYYGHHEGQGGDSAESALSEKILENNKQTDADVYSHVEAVVLIDKDGANALQIEVSGDSKTEETISADKFLESSIKISSDHLPGPGHILGTHQDEIGINQNMNLFQERVDYGQLDFAMAINKECDEENPCADGNNYVVGTSSLSSHDLTRSPLLQLLVLPDIHASNLQELDASFSNTTAFKMEPNSNIIGTQDESTLNASVSQSSIIHNTDGLEEIIADARNNKKTLFSAMQSVIGLMREVERKEQAAEQAKVEAAVGGADILAEVEDLKQTVQRMKEANGMHAGEVYGEKAILTTELRELQSRVLCLSDERDKSLAVLDEMHQTLEVRLAAAENEIKSMEQEKMEKEKAARKALAEQELIMETVVQESKILKQQAEDNAKLQEFLVDRGRVVDVLQGEIAVICQDVRLLKEKFDERVPYSKSLSSSQTSCILAASTSSVRSLIPEQVESAPGGAADSMESRKNRDEIFCSDEKSYEEKAAKDERKALLDDGWELSYAEKAAKDDQKALLDDGWELSNVEKAAKDALLDDGWELFDSHETYA